MAFPKEFKELGFLVYWFGFKDFTNYLIFSKENQGLMALILRNQSHYTKRVEKY